MSEFAERLRLLRESRQLTQVRLAELIEVDPRAYNRWERGTIAPHLDTLIKIADVFQARDSPPMPTPLISAHPL
jgi:transcriptional regulator with XRE-family HTH domain